MASAKKKEAEGIALLSMYNDEDMDVDEDEAEPHPPVEEDKERSESLNESDAVPSSSAPSTTPLFHSQTPVPDDDIGTLKSPAPLTPQPQLSLPSPSPSLPPPPPVLGSLDARTSRKGALAIVDYAHDETAMSPEAEEGEIVSTGRVMLDAELHAIPGNFHEKTPPGTVQILTPNIQTTPPQSSEQLEQSKSEISATMTYTKTEHEDAQDEVAAIASVETQKDVDPLENFLPPPPMTKCSEELQEKINKFLAYKRAGKSFNCDLRNRKDYRNPDFLQHAVRYQDIDQIGTCFSKDVFDPHGYDKSDYYDEIEADMKREGERKEQERKKSQKVEFVQGGIQPGAVPSAPKISTQVPGVAALDTSGLHSVSAAADAISRDSRQNKKTKWDKVDGDRRNSLHSGGQDTVSTASAHAALLSAANAGAGYTAFAQWWELAFSHSKFSLFKHSTLHEIICVSWQQKRREAEEKRSSERKWEKRS